MKRPHRTAQHWGLIFSYIALFFSQALLAAKKEAPAVYKWQPTQAAIRYSKIPPQGCDFRTIKAYALESPLEINSKIANCTPCQCIHSVTPFDVAQ